MTKEQVIKILSEEFIEAGLTHENAPPHHDCSEECGISIKDQIAASNKIMSPVRSGGKKHKRCLDCWKTYIENLAEKLVL